MNEEIQEFKVIIKNLETGAKKNCMYACIYGDDFQIIKFTYNGIINIPIFKDSLVKKILAIEDWKL